MCAKNVVEDVVVTWHINANRRVVIVCQSLHSRFPMFESRASCAIEISGAERVSTSTRKISCGERLCEQKKNCAACGSLLTNKKKHECNKPYCANCKRDMECGHLCYMATIKNELPRSDDVLFVFYDLKPLKIRRSTYRQHCMFLTSYACNSIVHGVRCCPT